MEIIISNPQNMHEEMLELVEHDIDIVNAMAIAITEN